ncbi:hypothetical protein [Pedobacter frigidisoli]|uniref:hypothetical protein n=1 Tax=Pedobacter frigidisoli TaxID=2530455 RepID=UPI002931B750|nr:hypothetical protein [Pedobacter frigidisoli]
MKIRLTLAALLTIFVTQSSSAQGCLINNYDQFDKVFNKPTAAGATTFIPGNGNNFVNYTGTCGPHTYIQVFGAPSGSCSVTENQVTKTGQYYTNVSQPFTQACNVPLDDNICWLLLSTGMLTYYFIKREDQLFKHYERRM